jgi:hypothetical protein
VAGNPKDLIDDIYHVLNAVHCDVYANGEEKRADYAGLLRTINTNVALYHGEIPTGQWLDVRLKSFLNGVSLTGIDNSEIARAKTPAPFATRNH